MRQINKWGRQIEILVISNMLNNNINENNIRLFTENNEQDTDTIQIFHVNNKTNYNLFVRTYNCKKLYKFISKNYRYTK